MALGCALRAARRRQTKAPIYSRFLDHGRMAMKIEFSEWWVTAVGRPPTAGEAELFKATKELFDYARKLELELEKCKGKFNMPEQQHRSQVMTMLNEAMEIAADQSESELTRDYAKKVMHLCKWILQEDVKKWKRASDPVRNDQ